MFTALAAGVRLAFPCGWCLREEPLSSGCSLQPSLNQVNKNGFCFSLPVKGCRMSRLEVHRSFGQARLTQETHLVRSPFWSRSLQLLGISQLICLLWVSKSIGPSPSMTAVSLQERKKGALRPSQVITADWSIYSPAAAGCIPSGSLPTHTLAGTSATSTSAVKSPGLSWGLRVCLCTHSSSEGLSGISTGTFNTLLSSQLLRSSR